MECGVVWMHFLDTFAFRCVFVECHALRSCFHATIVSFHLKNTFGCQAGDLQLLVVRTCWWHSIWHVTACSFLASSAQRRLTARNRKRQSFVNLPHKIEVAIRKKPSTSLTGFDFIERDVNSSPRVNDC